MAKEHRSATVSVQEQLVEYFFLVLAFGCLVFVLLPQVGYGFSATPTSYGNYHRITCNSSAFLRVPFRVGWACAFLLIVRPLLTSFGRSLGILVVSFCRIVLALLRWLV